VNFTVRPSADRLGKSLVPLLAAVGCALALAPSGCSRSTYTLMQMNLCLSGLAGCYGRAAYPAVVEEAVARIREAGPDAVTFNEACRSDVARIDRRTGYHLRFSRVIYRGELLRCVRPGGRGLFGVAVLTEAAIESTDSQDFEAQAGIERRRWLCVTTRVDVDVCTAHPNTLTTTEVAGNDARCVELAALLARRGDARTVIFGGDVNRHHSCAPPASGPAPTGPPSRPPDTSTSAEAARSARPRRRWCRPRTPTTTSCWSARTPRHPSRRTHRPSGSSRRATRFRVRRAMRLAVSIRPVGDVRHRGEGPDRAAS
jgi:endonuclease/exonuclease/phosphatase family metal-dependent hydrolase